MTMHPALRPLATLAVASSALASSALAQSGSETILGTANIFASGGNSPTAPGGGGAGTAPNLISLLAGTGRSIQFTTVTGTWSCGPGSNGPDGGSCAGSATNVQSAGSIAGIQTDSRTMFLVGVFLGGSLPATAPARLSYVAADFAQASFPAPQLGQVFFIGDGVTGTGSGSVQSFLIPDAATGLYLGVADAFAFNGDPGFYNDNSGSVTARYSVSGVSSVPEPSSLALAATGVLSLVGWGARRRTRG